MLFVICCSINKNINESSLCCEYADTDPTNCAVVGNDLRQGLKAGAGTGYSICTI